MGQKALLIHHFHKVCTWILPIQFLTPSLPLWQHQSVCTVHSRGQLFTFQLTFLWRKRQKHWWCLIFIMTLKSPLMLFSTADCFHQVHHSINNKKKRQGGWMAPDWPSHICHPSLSDEVSWSFDVWHLGVPNSKISLCRSNNLPCTSWHIRWLTTTLASSRGRFIST